MSTEAVAVVEPQEPPATLSDAEAVALLREMGADIELRAVQAAAKLKGWSSAGAMTAISTAQSFKALEELDFAARKGRELAENALEPEISAKGANLVAIVAKGRMAVLKQMEDAAKRSSPDSPKKTFRNLPPSPQIVLQQQFVSGEPKTVVEQPQQNNP